MEGRKTILLTTHNLERGSELGDGHMILVRGRIEYDRSRQSGEGVESIREEYYRLIEEGGGPGP